MYQIYSTVSDTVHYTYWLRTSFAAAVHLRMLQEQAVPNQLLRYTQVYPVVLAQQPQHCTVLCLLWQ
jgi:hypothetical protein